MPTEIGRKNRLKVSGCLHFFCLIAVFLFTSLDAHSQSTPGKPLVVAAASDLQQVLPDIAAEYTKKTGIPVRLTFGASGSFAAQLTNGAPFDVFLSADASYPKALVARGDADPGTLTFYARGQLAVWFRDGVLAKGEAASVRRLQDSGVRRIAIGNPQHAPYGRAAVAALKAAGVYDVVSAKLVMAENIAQAAQFVESGNADAGLVSVASLKAPKFRGGGQWSIVPAGDYPALDQAGIVTRRGMANPGAAEFLKFLKSETARAVFEKFGFLAASEGAR
jgi:molybdate transport system substrate-binding protein